jgi:hypothetical protein
MFYRSINNQKTYQTYLVTEKYWISIFLLVHIYTCDPYLWNNTISIHLKQLSKRSKNLDFSLAYFEYDIFLT